MNSSPTVKTIKYVGLDVHAETIAVGIAAANGDLRSYGNIPAHTVALDKLHRRLSEDGSEVRYVYEAGPTGFALCRHLRRAASSARLSAPPSSPSGPPTASKPTAATPSPWPACFAPTN